jgi:hypothetical protein
MIAVLTRRSSCARAICSDEQIIVALARRLIAETPAEDLRVVITWEGGVLN